MKYDPQTAELTRQLDQANERAGTYQGLYATSVVEITKLKNRIGRLKIAQRNAHMPFKGVIG